MNLTDTKQKNNLEKEIEDQPIVSEHYYHEKEEVLPNRLTITYEFAPSIHVRLDKETYKRVSGIKMHFKASDLQGDCGSLFVDLTTVNLGDGKESMDYRNFSRGNYKSGTLMNRQKKLRKKIRSAYFKRKTLKL